MPDENVGELEESVAWVLWLLQRTNIQTQHKLANSAAGNRLITSLIKEGYLTEDSTLNGFGLVSTTKGKDLMRTIKV